MLLVADPVGAQHLSTRTLTSDDGLTNMAVTALAQEPEGALWIGTENGVFRHDGEAIRGLDDAVSRNIHNVYAMVWGADGALWVGGRTGLFRRAQGQFTALQIQGAERWSLRRGQTLAALPDGSVLAIGLEGQLWRVTVKGNATRRELALPAQPLSQLGEGPGQRSIMVTRDGAWWFGCGAALCRWQSETLDRWAERDGVPADQWQGLMEASDGSIWARGNRHVARLPAGKRRFEDLTPVGMQNVLRNWLPLREDAAGRVLTPAEHGLYRWASGSWEVLDERNGLSANEFRAILLDARGDAWLGTPGQGLVHWRGYADWLSWTQRQGLPSDAIWSIADDGAGRLWIGTGRGVVSTGPNGTQLRAEARSVAGQVGAMAADGLGGMWLATFEGDLYLSRAGVTRRWLVGKDAVRVLRIWGGGGQLWVAHDHGVLTLPIDGSGNVNPHAGLDRLWSSTDRRVNAVCGATRGGPVWLATGDGLFRYDADHGFTRVPVEGLAVNQTLANVVCGAGHLWVRDGFDHRLFRIDLKDKDAALRAELVAPPVLKGRHLLSLMEDHRGWLWAGTDAGVVRWNGKDWRRYDESNGLVWNDCNQNALAEDAQGDIWIGTSGGVSRIDVSAQAETATSLPLRLGWARLGETDLVVGRNMRLPWSTQALEVRWEVPIFSNRQALHTRYRLRGRDDAWADVARGELRYAGLNEGRYSLELVAVNDDLGLSSPPLVLDFTIDPPWWRSPAAWALGLGLTLLAAFLAYRVRVGRLMRRQAELETQMQERMRDLAERRRMAERLEESQHLLRELAQRNEDAREDERRHLKREIHDELGQYLAALRLGISVVDLQLGQQHSALQEKTRGLVQMVDATIKVVRNVVAGLRPSALDLGIVSALEWLAQEFSTRTGIHCTFQSSTGEVKMDDKRATAVLRIAQESLTNVLRHAQATEVSISLQENQGFYELDIQDNGVGFDPSVRKEKSFGLVGMRERALALHGDVTITSEPGCTRLRVRFPV